MINNLERKVILICLVVLFMALMAPNTSAGPGDCSTPACHQKYYDAINAKKHTGSDGCVYCHDSSYAPGHSGSYLGKKVTETTCKQSTCHGPVGSRPTDESHGNKYHGPNYADCTQCHFANTTKQFPHNSTYYEHDHNFTVEYNFYDYNISGMPLSTNNGTGKGIFPYYTCTLTCHGTGAYSVEDEVISWNESAHARSRHGNETYDSKNSCAKCKSPPNYNASGGSSDPIAEAAWQGIQCRVCHNIHNDTYSGTSSPAFPLAFYNSTASSLAGKPVYEQVANATVLCEQCHTGSSHDSKFAGPHKDTAGFNCASCHANASFNNGTHKFEVKNTTSGVTGCEVCHELADHTWQYTGTHIAKVTCEACHDRTVSRNATGFAVSSNNTYGIYNDSSTNNWTSYKVSHGAASTWPLHNISKDVTCVKCHNATSVYSGPIANALTCADCHASYSNVVNSTRHNKTLNPSAPSCTDCHSGYEPDYKHVSGNRGYIVNESNSCRNCHIDNISGFYERHTGSSDCTKCHFANTTQLFSLNASLYTHDHNMTVERNFYAYNLSGMPLTSNSGTGIGMFPYYSCTLACHKNYGEPLKVDEAAISWFNSSHARSRHGNDTYDSKNSCAKCKSPPNYNASGNSSDPIAEADWQGIQCRVCHNLHDRKFPNNTGPSGFPVAYYNSTASSLAGYAVYEQVANATELCERCHTGSSHDSKFAGIHKETVGFTCTNCHSNSTFNDELHLFEVKNTTSGVTGCEVCHNAVDHTWQYTSYHTNKVSCVGCHDRTVGLNTTSGNATSEGNTYGIFKDPTNNWTTYKVSHGAPAVWPLHNISEVVNCNKCHVAKSEYDGTIASALSLACTDYCHASYASVVNASKHNQTLYPSAPGCTDCHTGYLPNYGHITGSRGYIVNESNTCRTCHIDNVSGFYERHTSSSDCTQCHFGNTTQRFNLNTSLFTHDHNLTIEYNFHKYNLSGIPLASNAGMGTGMFPYYSCQLPCHGTGYGNVTSKTDLNIDEAARSWFNSSHARSRHGDETYDSKNSCAKCKSPPNYNASASSSAPIAEADWQGIQCRVCHNLHDRKFPNNTGPSGFPVAYYNSTASSLAGYAVYEQVANATELCEKCHTGSSHDSKFAGIHKDSTGFTCTSCHSNSTFNNESHLFEVKNNATGVTGCEVCHTPATDHVAYFDYQYHGNVTCWACHDNTVSRNSSTDYVVSSDNNYGIYKDTTTNKWTTYKVSHGSAATWPLHNISKNITCSKCHGARSVYSGGIAPGFGGEVTYSTTDTLVSGYNLILVLVNPDPPIYAKDLLFKSAGGIPGATKAMRWDSTNQTWQRYEYIVASDIYLGTNFTVDGYKAYFVKGNATTAGTAFTFKGRR